jgi:ketosteroid isomerase-like protein
MFGCRDAVRQTTPLERAQIERTIKAEVVAAYDFSKPNVVERLMALYAPQSRIISASGGHVVTARDSLRLGIEAFWDNVGHNMRNPTVDWTSMYIDVLSPTSAVMTATYRIPHRQPNGLPHVIGGAWTAVFEKMDGRWLIIQEHLSDDPYAH